jgi:hypothetical protein
MRKSAVGLLCVVVSGCMPTQSVRPSDVQAWAGQPVEKLDTQPFFLTVPMTRTVTASGVEIRNYSNSKAVSSCDGGGTAYSGTVNATTTCVSQTAACNNLFYIQSGRVIRYEPVSSGGGICVTDDRVLPQSSF